MIIGGLVCIPVGRVSSRCIQETSVRGLSYAFDVKGPPSPLGKVKRHLFRYWGRRDRVWSYEVL